MKLWGILLLFALLIDPGRIGKINAIKSEAKKAFEAGDFKTAISKYRYLIDSMGVTEEEVRLNLAHAYFKADDTLSSYNSYLPLTQSNDRRFRSLANQQLGVLANRQGNSDVALNFFKQALLAAPENEDARVNYEMIKKKLADQKKQEQQNDQNQNKDQEPSAFAKALKAKADELVRQRRYQEAHQIMTDGLKKDKTVSAYNEFIKRTQDVAGIAK